MQTALKEVNTSTAIYRSEINSRASTSPERLTRRHLSHSTLPAGLTRGSLADVPERIVQFGEGNFLRAFTDWMVDLLNEKGSFNGQIVAVQPIRNGLADCIGQQDGLYTLILRGIHGGEVSESRRVITSVSRALNPYEEWMELVWLMQSPDVRFVFSNTIEAGSCAVAVWPRSATPSAPRTPKPRSVKFSPFRTAQPLPS